MVCKSKFQTVSYPEPVFKGHRLKQRSDTRFIFDSVSLFFRAVHALSTGHYRLAMRKFIMDLFDFQFDSSLIKELNEKGRMLILDYEDVEELGEDEEEVEMYHLHIPERLSRKYNAKARISVVTPRVNDEGSDDDVDVVGGLLGNGDQVAVDGANH